MLSCGPPSQSKKAQSLILFVSPHACQACIAVCHGESQSPLLLCTTYLLYNTTEPAMKMLNPRLHIFDFKHTITSHSNLAFCPLLHGLHSSLAIVRTLPSTYKPRGPVPPSTTDVAKALHQSLRSRTPPLLYIHVNIILPTVFLCYVYHDCEQYVLSHTHRAAYFPSMIVVDLM
jgi:hypothetical protein